VSTLSRTLSKAKTAISKKGKTVSKKGKVAQKLKHKADDEEEDNGEE